MKAPVFASIKVPTFRYMPFRRHPDTLLEDFLQSKGEFSIRVDEALEDQIRKNIEAKKAGLI